MVKRISVAGEPTEGISKLASDLIKHSGGLVSHEVKEPLERFRIPLHYIRIIAWVRKHQSWPSGSDSDMSVSLSIPLLPAQDAFFVLL